MPEPSNPASRLGSGRCCRAVLPGGVRIDSGRSGPRPGRGRCGAFPRKRRGAAGGRRSRLAPCPPNRAFWSHVPVQFERPEARWEGVMRIAVTGASGQIGSQVVRLLAGEQAHQVVALSRRALPSGRWPAGVSARAADYADLEALSTALRGADTLVFVSSDGPGAQVMVHHHNVIRAARASGVAQIVALSSLDADPARRSATRSATGTPSGCSPRASAWSRSPGHRSTASSSSGS